MPRNIHYYKRTEALELGGAGSVYIPADNAWGYDFDMEEPVKKVCRAAKSTARKAAKAAPKKLNDIYIMIASLALGLVVFFSLGILASAERGFNGGIGGEIILALTAFVGLRFLWSKIKKHLKD